MPRIKVEFRKFEGVTDQYTLVRVHTPLDITKVYNCWPPETELYRYATELTTAADTELGSYKLSLYGAAG